MNERDAAVRQAMERATRPVADNGDGWETTAAVLAHEVQRLRAVGDSLVNPNCRGYGLDDPVHAPGSRPGSNCPICDEWKS